MANTLNTVAHYNFQLALIVHDTEELLKKLIELQRAENYDFRWCFYGTHKIVSNQRESLAKGDITEIECLELKSKIKVFTDAIKCREDINIDRLENIARLYIKGGIVDWNKIYKVLNCQKISMPGYPFLENRCWIDVPVFSTSTR